MLKRLTIGRSFSLSPILLLLVMAGGLLVSTLLSLGIGDKPIGPALVIRSALGLETTEQKIDATIVRQIRAPRVLTAILVGMMLALSGAVLQAVFRNPLADPGLIGVSAGGAAGAVLFIVFSGALIPVGWDWLQQTGLILFPMITGVLVTVGVYQLSRFAGRTHVVTMLLTGLAVNALVGALIGYAIFFSDDNQLRDFTFWSLGSLSRANWGQLQWLTPVILTVSACLLLYRKQLNILLLGESAALHLGVNVERSRRQLIFLTACGVSVAVALCGMIGFIGLVIPHFCRLLIGPDHKYLLPASALCGALVLVAADLLARVSVRYTELPVGVVTATIGAPFFLYLVARSKQGSGM